MRPIQIRFPDELLEWIKQKAAAERRGMKDQIVWMLEQLKRAEEAAAGVDPANA